MMKLFKKLFGPKKTLGEMMLENAKYQEDRLRQWEEKRAVKEYWNFLKETKKSVKKCRRGFITFPKYKYMSLINDKELFADLKAELAKENLEVILNNKRHDLEADITVKPARK